MTQAATRVEGIVSGIRQQIASRCLLPGARLPSIRRYAAASRVSVSTVVDAYERLVAEGLVASRPGSGFFVRGPVPPLSLVDLGPRLDREVDPLWMSRQALEAPDGVLKPGCGWLPSSWMPEAALRRAVRRLGRAPAATLTDYDTPLGSAALRQVLARRMGERGIATSPGQVLLVESGTQAIDLLCRYLLSPGDAVLVDDPCYFNFHALLRAHQARVVGVPFTPRGPELDLFAQALATHRPRLYVTTAALHNPTGATLSPAVAHRVLRLAAEAGCTIVEDDILGDFEEQPAPRLAALDGLDRVVQVGSFSKSLSASVRCGHIAARRDWIEDLADLKTAVSFGGSRLSAELIHALLMDGTYRRHMEGVRRGLASARADVARRLRPLGIVPWIEPRGGMFLWCELPAGVDAATVARRALAQDVVLAPGNAFSTAGTAGRFMRFNVAQCGSERMFEVLAAAMRP
jgi:DNA-binding transcriptional MocR family regulator